MELRDYVLSHAERGDCTCGGCGGSSDHIEKRQSEGETVDLTFFKVKNKDGNKDEFLSLVKKDFSHWLDGKEHSYISVGADIGDQGIALMTIGLGHLLGVWKAQSPETMMPFLPDDLKQKMAGQGLVCLQCAKA